MKKKILALLCAMTLVCSMSLTAFAATASGNSATAGEEAAEATADEDDDDDDNGAQDSQSETVSVANSTGQVLTGATLAEFAQTTTISSGVAGAKLGAVSNETAQAIISEANRVVGTGAFIASVVDLQVPAGTGTATFTLGCPNVWKGQTVRIVHQKADGSFEVITPSNVGNNTVTFTMTSYSPIAIVVNAQAPKTADAGMATSAMILLLAMAGAAMAVVYGRKVKA